MPTQNDTTVSDSTNTAASKLDNLKDSAKHLVEQGQEKAGQARDAIVTAKDKVVSSSTDLIAGARSTIIAHPLTAVAAAFGVGYVAMRIFRR